MKRALFLGGLVALLLTPSAFADPLVNSESYSRSYSNSNSSGNTSTYVSTPGLTSAGNQSCAGSSSFGGSVLGFGFSGASTTEMPGCEARNDALVLHQLGQRNAGLLRMCQNPRVAVAMAYDDKPCPPEYYTPAQRRMIWGTPSEPAAKGRRPAVSPKQMVVESTKRRYNTSTNRWE